MNLADMTTVVTLLGCPIAAGLSAGSERAGWLTVVFVALGVGLGFAGAYCVRGLPYLLLFSGCKQQRAWLSVPLFLGYMFLPMLAGFAFMSLTGVLTVFLVRHIL